MIDCVCAYNFFVCRYNYYSHLGEQPFYRETLCDDGGNFSIFFGVEAILQEINRMDNINLSVDGTFKCVPRFCGNGFLQIFIIYAVYSNMVRVYDFVFNSTQLSALFVF